MSRLESRNFKVSSSLGLEAMMSRLDLSRFSPRSSSACDIRLCSWGKIDLKAIIPLMAKQTLPVFFLIILNNHYLFAISLTSNC